jgi:hypothetical protein
MVLAAVLVAALVGIIAPKKPAPESTFVWLDPSQFARQRQPGRLKRLYYKVVNFTAPVWRHFTRPKTHILITSKILSVHGVTTSELGIGAATATNETGAQIWLLSPSAVADLRQRLNTANGIEVVNAPSVTTADGLPASIFVGHAQPQTLASIGVSLDVNPKIVAHQFHFDLNAVYTDANNGASMTIRTNLSAACRVRLSNASGVLITSPGPKEVHGTNCWLILSATAIDGFGRTINL